MQYNSIVQNRKSPASMNNCNFLGVSKEFRIETEQVLKSELTQTHIVSCLHMMRKFAVLRMDNEQIKAFLDDAVRYFVVLNTYACRSTEPKKIKQYVMRKAVGGFFAVIEKPSLDTEIAMKIRKIVDALVGDDVYHIFLKQEFLRIYSLVVDKFPFDFVKILAETHSCFEKFCPNMKLYSIETQAITIEVILKLFKCSNNIRLNESFPSIANILDTDYLNRNLYPNIRRILDELNKDSQYIFSINCDTITLDGRRIEEFDGCSNADDVWLDINLLEQTLSFFCCPNFAYSLEGSKLYRKLSDWEVLSLYVDDILKKTIAYSSSGILNIEIWLKTSDLSLFLYKKCDKVRKLQISISAGSDGFDKLVKEVLPKIFFESFSAKSVGIDVRDLDSSTTIELSSGEKSSEGDSSPIIEHFEMKKRFSTVDDTPIITLSDLDNQDGGNGDLIIVSSPTKECLKKRGVRETLEKLRVSESPGTVIKTKEVHTKRSCLTPEYSDNDVKQAEKNSIKFTKTSTATRNVFDRSISPISFTESVFGKRNRPRPTDSRHKVSSSTLEREILKPLSKTIENGKKKISTIVYKRKSKKISSSLSSIIQNTKVSNSVISKFKRSTPHNISHFALDMTIEEKALDLADSCKNRYNEKVEDWLQKVVPAVPEYTFMDNNFDGEPSPVLYSPTQDQNCEIQVEEVSSVLTPEITQRNPNLGPEENIALMMLSTGDRMSEIVVNDDKFPFKQIEDNELLKVLTSEDEDLVVQPIQEKVKSNDNNLDRLETMASEEKGVVVSTNVDTDSSDDNLPLVMLVSKRGNDLQIRKEKSNSSKVLQDQVETSIQGQTRSSELKDRVPESSQTNDRMVEDTSVAINFTSDLERSLVKVVMNSSGFVQDQIEKSIQDPARASRLSRDEATESTHTDVNIVPRMLENTYNRVKISSLCDRTCGDNVTKSEFFQNQVEKSIQNQAKSPRCQELVTEISHVNEEMGITGNAVNDISVDFGRSFENNIVREQIQNTSNFSDINSSMVKKRKRKLYNPSDLSYLSLCVPDTNDIESRSHIKPNSDVSRNVMAKNTKHHYEKRKPQKIKPVKSKGYRSKPKHNKKEEPKQDSHKNESKSCKKKDGNKKGEMTTACKVVDTIVHITPSEPQKTTIKPRRTGLFSDKLIKLKEDLRQKKKMQKRLMGKGVESTSSSSSMEPFGVVRRSRVENIEKQKSFTKNKKLGKKINQPVTHDKCSTHNKENCTYKGKTPAVEKSIKQEISESALILKTKRTSKIKSYLELSSDDEWDNKHISTTTSSKRKIKDKNCEAVDGTSTLVPNLHDISLDFATDSKTSKPKKNSKTTSPLSKHRKSFTNEHGIIGDDNTTKQVQIISNVVIHPAEEELEIHPAEEELEETCHSTEKNSSRSSKHFSHSHKRIKRASDTFIEIIRSVREPCCKSMIKKYTCRFLNLLEEEHKS